MNLFYLNSLFELQHKNADQNRINQNNQSGLTIKLMVFQIRRHDLHQLITWRQLTDWLEPFWEHGQREP